MHAVPLAAREIAYSSLGAGSGNPSYPGLPQRGLIFNFGLSFGCVSEAPDNVGGIFVNTVVAMPGSLFSLTLHRTLRNELQGALTGLGLPGAALGVTTTSQMRSSVLSRIGVSPF